MIRAFDDGRLRGRPTDDGSKDHKEAGMGKVLTAGAARTLPRLLMIVPVATIVNVVPPSIQEHLGYSRTRVAVGCAGSMP